MDKLESLGQTLSQVTLYDLKSMYNQAKNMVLNVSEMEAKVREATNDEPWGASSTLMQEIANGTHNFQQFNEIMPCIYSRFMDKEARQWREIYKALQLLEYIIKHGSERVVDDARSHLSTIKMLRNFHYIDDKGKDQGINVRNRAKELTELLMDVDRIRTERRKAKTNRNKYVGTGNDPTSFTSGRYEGFGSDSIGRGYGGGGYDSSYGGYGGSSSSGFRDDRRFDEYNAGDDDIHPSRRSGSVATSSGNTGGMTGSRASTSGQTTTKAQEKVVDLLGFDDDDYSTPVSAPATTTAATTLPALNAAPSATGKEKALPSNPLDDGEDDFAEFQAAPTSAPVSPAPNAGANTSANANIFAALASTEKVTFSQPAVQQRPVQATSVQGFGARPASAASLPTLGSTPPISPSANRTGFGSPIAPTSQPMTPTAFGGSGMGVLSPTTTGVGARPAAAQTTAVKGPAASGAPARPSSTSVGFDDLWNMSLGSSKSASGAGASNAGAGGSKSIKDLEKEKARASIWGGVGARTQPPSATGSNSMGLGGASFGVSGGASGSAGGSGSSAGAGGDDLLL